jgi:predicted dehydrogenase
VSARVLLVGYGRRGRAWRAAVDRRPASSVAGIVDRDAGARAAAEASGLAAWDSLDAALPVAAADAAVVASPPAVHASHAIACLDRGLGVLVEKPLALSLEDAVAVADAADAVGRPAVAGHNFRHRPIELTIRRALESGAIGKLRFAAVVSARPAADHDFEHGPLWDLGVHHIDLLRVRFGGPPDVVEARCTSSSGLTYSLHLEWDGGASADYTLREGGSVYHHAEWLEGSAGALRAVDGKVSLVTTTRRPRRLRVRRAPAPELVLLDALLDGKHGAVAAREALGTIATLEAAVRALALDRPAQAAR